MLFRLLTATYVLMMVWNSAAVASYLVVTTDAAITSLADAKAKTQNAPTGQAKRAHIFVAGRSGDLGASPMIAALAGANRVSRLYPDDVVILYLVTTPRYKDGTYLDPINASDSAHHNIYGSRAIVEHFGFKLLHTQDATLDFRALVKELAGFSTIASLDFYGHSSIPSGIMLDSKRDEQTKSAWRPFDYGAKDESGKEITGVTASLKGRFTEDAFAYVHGCNGGHLIAHWLAQELGIAVAGNYTAVHFEVDTALGKADAPPHYVWSNKLEPNLTAMQSMRMKSDDVDYVDADYFFGNYRQGLPHYRFFCANDNSACQKGIAHSTLALVTTVRPKKDQTAQEYYAAIAREAMCPSDFLDVSEDGEAKLQSIQSECLKVLEGVTTEILTNGSAPVALRGYTPYRSKKSMVCEPHHGRCYHADCYGGKFNFLSVGEGKKWRDQSPPMLACATRLNFPALKPKPDVLAPTVAVRSDADRRPIGSTSFMDEYVAMIRAFDQIKGAVPKAFMEPAILPRLVTIKNGR